MKPMMLSALVIATALLSTPSAGSPLYQGKDHRITSHVQTTVANTNSAAQNSQSSAQMSDKLPATAAGTQSSPLKKHKDHGVRENLKR